MDQVEAAARFGFTVDEVQAVVALIGDETEAVRLLEGCARDGSDPVKVALAIVGP